MDKKRTLGYLPGGKNKYAESLLKILEFIQSRNPTSEELRAWYDQTFPSAKSLTAYKTGISTIENIDLIIITKNAVSLTDLGIRFSQTKDNQLISESLRRNYVGVDEITLLLRERPRTLREISSSLSPKLGLGWKSDIQWRIRLDWLESFQLVTRTEGKYQLVSEKRRPIHEDLGKVKKGQRLHDEVIDRLLSGGKNIFLVKKEYPLDGKRVDAVWMQGEDCDPLTVFEVHFRGNIDGTLKKLRMARRKWNASLILVTDDEGMSKAKVEIEKGYPELDGVVEVLHYKEIDKFVKNALSAELYKKTIEKLIRRKTGVIVRESERNKGKHLTDDASH